MSGRLSWVHPTGRSGEGPESRSRCSPQGRPLLGQGITCGAGPGGEGQLFERQRGRSVSFSCRHRGGSVYKFGGLLLVAVCCSFYFCWGGRVVVVTEKRDFPKSEQHLPYHGIRMQHLQKQNCPFSEFRSSLKCSSERE